MEIPMSSLKKKQSGRIVRIEGGFGVQRKFRTLGFREDKNVKMVAHQPINGPIVIEIDGRQVTIGRGLANKAIVEL